MEQIGKTTLSANGADSNRIGDEVRSKLANNACKFEKLSELSPLPATFDVSPIHPPYFTEFSYTDILGGMYFSTMSSEVNARILKKCFEETKPTYCYINEFIKVFEDKYVLNSESTEGKFEDVVFPPGSNQVHVIDRDILDKQMFNEQSTVVKPHPLTNEDTLRNYGISYGYGRILEPKLSGIQILKQCKRAYTTSSSEIGIICAALKIPFQDITRVRHSHKTTYAGIYNLFKDWDVEHNYNVINALLEGNSGFVFDLHNRPEQRVKDMYKTAMEIRQVFKPSYPQLEFQYPTEKGTD